MLTLLELRRQIRALVGGAVNWPDVTLDRYIADAIRFYSLEFPRRYRHELKLMAGTQVYPLPGGHDMQAVLSVEYPLGATPVQLLRRVEEWSDAFQRGEAVYALRGVPDDLDDEEDTACGMIVFGPSVAEGERAVITYLGAHPIPAVGDYNAVITVPEAHIEALVAFVDFRAHWQLESAQALTVTTVSIVLAQLGQEARMAWRRYKEVVDRLHALSSDSSAIVSWGQGWRRRR